MIAVDDNSTIGETFFRAAQAYAGESMLALPVNPARLPRGRGGDHLSRCRKALADREHPDHRHAEDQKHQIFEPGVDPRTLSGMIELHALKKQEARCTASSRPPPTDA